MLGRSLRVCFVGYLFIWFDVLSLCLVFELIKSHTYGSRDSFPTFEDTQS